MPLTSMLSIADALLSPSGDGTRRSCGTYKAGNAAYTAENVEHHQLKTRVGRLELIPLVLELFQPADDARRFGRIFVKARRERRGLREHGGSARDFAH